MSGSPTAHLKERAAEDEHHGHEDKGEKVVYHRTPTQGVDDAGCSFRVHQPNRKDEENKSAVETVLFANDRRRKKKTLGATRAEEIVRHTNDCPPLSLCKISHRGRCIAAYENTADVRIHNLCY